ncbi:MAG: hypothetical protein NTX24_04575 [Candidatus Pacearchaeota archaeon]|nr:hypothetical protein [Candidatus Pacearchaeota archaeon]
MSAALVTRVEDERLPDAEERSATPIRENGHFTNEYVESLKGICGYLRQGGSGKEIRINAERGTAKGYCYCAGNGTMQKCRRALGTQFSCKFYPR